MKLVISVDVEEEGLFCGQYHRKPLGVKNVAHLRRIECVSKEFGFPFTLLAAYPVACDRSCQDVLLFWRNELGAEIGAHLHPWNTPPFEDLAYPEPIPSDLFPMPLLSAKLESLIAALHDNLQVVPTAFRMGRFNFGAQVRSLLPRYGFRVDSSIVALRLADGGPDQFLPPSDPFWLRYNQEYPPVLEAPVTMVPISQRSSRIVDHLAHVLPRQEANLILRGFRIAAVLSINPAWHPLAAMKLAAHLHRRRGGQVLHMFLHSSELAPGATPQYPSEAAARRLVRKIRAFLDWLVRTGPVHGVTLSELDGRGEWGKPPPGKA